jgi:hypothetical protein
MKFGFVLPGGTARQQLELAVAAEGAGWDGVFVWEAAYGVDAWSLLAAMAVRTAQVRLGTMLTPLPWRRPWKVASQAATLDALSHGRAILAVGLGAVDTALGNTGEQLDRRVRAELLDEGIDLITGLWGGDLRFSGRHFDIDLSVRDDLVDVAGVVQRPRIPIWVVGAWPYPKSMQRVLRCDGLLPNVKGDDGFRPPTVTDIGEMIGWFDAHGGRRPGFDVVTEGETPPDPATAGEQVRPWAEAGCTWWLETRWEMPHHSDDRLRDVRERIDAGPPV